MKECKIKNCNKPIHAKRLCKKHYMRICRKGLTDNFYFTRTIIERILRRIKSINPYDCWKSSYFHNEGGYSKIRINKKTKRTHRVIYEILIEKIPDGMDLDHTCRRRWCLNPGHLEIVTRKENVKRGNSGYKKRKDLKCQET